MIDSAVFFFVSRVVCSICFYLFDLTLFLFPFRLIVPSYSNEFNCLARVKRSKQKGRKNAIGN